MYKGIYMAEEKRMEEEKEIKELLTHLVKEMKYHSVSEIWMESVLRMIPLNPGAILLMLGWFMKHREIDYTPTEMINELIRIRHSEEKDIWTELENSIFENK